MCAARSQRLPAGIMSTVISPHTARSRRRPCVIPAMVSDGYDDLGAAHGLLTGVILALPGCPRSRPSRDLEVYQLLP